MEHEWGAQFAKIKLLPKKNQLKYQKLLMENEEWINDSMIIRNVINSTDIKSVACFKIVQSKLNSRFCYFILLKRPVNMVL